MTHKLIKTDNYLLIVDDSQITVDDWAYNPFGDCPISVGDIEDDMLYINSEYSKIIAHLPLNNSPILEGVDLLPPVEYEPRGFDEYEYTEKDLRDAIRFVADNYSIRSWQNYDNKTGVNMSSDAIADKFIQSIQKSKMPVAFVCDIEVIGNVGEKIFTNIISISNSQGLTQWVGDYIFNN
jgi:hypothetical protein